jgi:hypothetical protein
VAAKLLPLLCERIADKADLDITFWRWQSFEAIHFHNPGQKSHHRRSPDHPLLAPFTMQTVNNISYRHKMWFKQSQSNLQAGRPSAVTAVPISRSQRSRCSTQLRAADARQPIINAVIIDLDAVVQGLEVVSTAWAFAAATATAGDIAGSPGVYTRCMQQLLPVLQQPCESVLMLRLLHEEGIVGKERSCSCTPWGGVSLLH